MDYYSYTGLKQGVPSARKICHTGRNLCNCYFSRQDLYLVHGWNQVTSEGSNEKLMMKHYSGKICEFDYDDKEFRIGQDHLLYRFEGCNV